MRCIIMHRTNAHWESAATPGPALIARVGRLLANELAAGFSILRTRRWTMPIEWPRARRTGDVKISSPDARNVTSAPTRWLHIARRAAGRRPVAWLRRCRA